VRCYHEAGHSIAHQFFGHKIIEVKTGSDAEAGCRVAPQKVEALDFIVACCGGKAAVDQLYRAKATTDKNWQASKDHADAFRVALHVSDGDAQAAELLVKWGERMADVVCLRLWPQIHKLAFALLEHGSLSGEHVKQLIQSHNGKDAWNDRRAVSEDKNV